MLTLTKLDVQRKVLKNGKPLDLALFDWDENTRTFKSNINGLDLNFSISNNVNFICGDDCSFITNSDCTFKTGNNCTFSTNYNCSFNTYSDCKFETGNECSFDTGPDCTFKTGNDCDFFTFDECSFETGNNCLLDTDFGCKFETGNNCVVNRRETNETIHLKANIETILCPFEIEGYIYKKDDKYVYSKDEENEYIIIDNILSKVISRKGNVLKVQNYNDSKESYIVKDGDLYSHGETIEEARKSLIYKIGNRDTSMYKDLNLDSILPKDECIKMYRVITGACEFGTKNFVSKQEHSKIKDKYSIRELIELTKGQFGNDILVKFLKGE